MCIYFVWGESHSTHTQVRDNFVELFLFPHWFLVCSSQTQAVRLVCNVLLEPGSGPRCLSFVFQVSLIHSRHSFGSQIFIFRSLVTQTALSGLNSCCKPGSFCSWNLLASISSACDGARQGRGSSILYSCWDHFRFNQNLVSLMESPMGNYPTLSEEPKFRKTYLSFC